MHLIKTYNKAKKKKIRNKGRRSEKEISSVAKKHEMFHLGAGVQRQSHQLALRGQRVEIARNAGEQTRGEKSMSDMKNHFLVERCTTDYIAVVSVVVCSRSRFFFLHFAALFFSAHWRDSLFMYFSCRTSPCPFFDGDEIAEIVCLRMEFAIVRM